VIQWEDRLKKIFDRIDAYLEQTYGARYPLHPARPPEGVTSNPEQDGLFNVGAAFTPGYGSEHGRGYVVEIQMSTLAPVPTKVRTQIEQDVVRMLRQQLQDEFPDRKLEVLQDGNILKISGDLRFEQM
jgi:hypothetical protein